MTSGPPNLHRHDSEKYFTDPAIKKGDKRVKFPSIHDEGSIDLSVIVPAYNEEDRCKFNVLISLYKNAFQWKADRPLADRCVGYGYIVNKL